MAVSPFDAVRGAPPPITRTPLTGVVTKTTSEGVYVAPLGGDHRIPIGPCRGGEGLTVGAVCVLIWTQEQPWAVGAAAGLPGEPGPPGAAGAAGEQGTRWGTTPSWVLGSFANAQVTFPDGQPPRVGDLVVSTNGFGLGDVERVTAVVDATHADLQFAGYSLRGPAGAPAPTPTVLTAGAAANLTGTTTLATWLAGTTASLPWIAFTAPASGIVEVMVNGSLKPPTDGTGMLHDFEIRTGDVFGAGTVARAAQLGTAGGNYNVNHVRTRGGGRVTGLTAGAKYHARSMYQQASGSGGQITNAYMELTTY